MKNTVRLMFVCVVAVIGFASCAQKELGISPMVPSDALGFVQISDTEKFIANTDAFIQPLGITALTGNLGVKDLLTMALKSGAQLDLSALDLKKPIGFAVLAPAAGSTDFGIIMYIPLLKPEESSPKIEEMFKKIPGMNSTIYKGYGIYYNGAKQSFPLAKSLSIPDSLTFEPGTITAYADIQSILGHYKAEYEELKKVALAEVESSEQAMSADLGKVSATMVTEFFKGVEQTRNLAVHLRADATGIASGSTVEFTPEGSIAKIIKDVGPGKDIASLTKYIPASFLLSGAISGNPLAFKELNKATIDLYMTALKLDDPTKQAFTALIEDSLKLAGKNSTVSFDLGLDPKLTQTAEQDIMANLSSLFTVRAVAVSEISNAEDYKKFLQASINNGAISSYMNKLLEPSGLNLKFSLDDVKDGDFAFQQLKFDLQVANVDKMDLDNEAARSMATMSAGILEKFTVSVVAKGTHAYMVLGDEGPDALKKLTSSDRIENSVEKNEHWQNWLKTVPTDAQFIGNLSIARILDIVKVATKNEVSISIPEADKSGIFTYVRVVNSRIDTSGFWGLKELIPLVKEGMKDSGNLMNLFSGTTKVDPGSESDMTMPDGAAEESETTTTVN